MTVPDEAIVPPEATVDAAVAIWRAICNPGRITMRKHDETVSEWQVRALNLAAAPLLRAEGAAAERDRIRNGMERRHRIRYADLLDGAP